MAAMFKTLSTGLAHAQVDLTLSTRLGQSLVSATLSKFPNSKATDLVKFTDKNLNSKLGVLFVKAATDMNKPTNNNYSHLREMNGCLRA